MNYPKEFIDDMQKLWTRYGSREEAEAFFAALDAPRCRRSLRFNLQKLRRAGVVDDRPESLKNYLEDFCQRYQIPFQRVLWTQAGLYYPDTLRASQCIEYLQGLFYIQEASAMLPAELLDAAPGSRMIDLCAAPGGKTLRMAEALEEGGWLFSNDYSRSRAKVLRYNVRHFGLQRVAVYSASPEAFAQEMPASMDAVLIDAPCSGEGMIRRKPASRLARSEYPPENFVPLQAEILDAGARLLKPGGVLVYSTCTFNLAENEAQVLAFLERHPDFELDDGLPHFPAGSGLDRGFPYEGQELLKRCLRIFPHHCEGEGHFAARFIRRSAETCLSSPRVLNSKAKRPKKARKSGQGTNLKLALEAYQNFLSQNHCGDAEGESYFLLDDTLVEAQIPPEELPKSAGIHCLHSGLSLGQVKIDRRGRARFVPDPLLALSKPIEFFGQRLELKPASDALRKLLQGQTLSLEDLPEAAAFDASYFLASYRGFGLSLLKREGSQIKNLFPAYFHGRALDLVQILAAGTSGEPSIEEDDE